jgi:hypothetical protein
MPLGCSRQPVPVDVRGRCRGITDLRRQTQEGGTSGDVPVPEAARDVQNALLAAHPGRTTLGANVDNITERLQRLYAVKIAALPIFARLRARITRSPQTRDR